MILLFAGTEVETDYTVRRTYDPRLMKQPLYLITVIRELTMNTATKADKIHNNWSFSYFKLASRVAVLESIMCWIEVRLSWLELKVLASLGRKNSMTFIMLLFTFSEEKSSLDSINLIKSCISLLWLCLRNVLLVVMLTCLTTFTSLTKPDEVGEVTSRSSWLCDTYQRSYYILHWV